MSSTDKNKYFFHKVEQNGENFQRADQHFIIGRFENALYTIDHFLDDLRLSHHFSTEWQLNTFEDIYIQNREPAVFSSDDIGAAHIFQSYSLINPYIFVDVKHIVHRRKAFNGIDTAYASPAQTSLGSEDQNYYRDGVFTILNITDALSFNLFELKINNKSYRISGEDLSLQEKEVVSIAPNDQKGKQGHHILFVQDKLYDFRNIFAIYLDEVLYNDEGKELCRLDFYDCGVHGLSIANIKNISVKHGKFVRAVNDTSLRIEKDNWQEKALTANDLKTAFEKFKLKITTSTNFIYSEEVYDPLESKKVTETENHSIPDYWKVSAYYGNKKESIVRKDIYFHINISVSN